MSDLCHICGPVKYEAPTVICAPCALAGCSQSSPEHGHGSVVTPRRPFVFTEKPMAMTRDFLIALGHRMRVR